MNMTTSEEFRKALLGTRARRRLNIGESKVQVDMRLLSTRELLDAEEAKSAYLNSKNLINDGTCQVLEGNSQILFRSLLKPDTTSRVFDNVDDIRDLPQEQVMWLADQYTILSDSNNPNISDLSKDDIEAVKKKLLSGEEVNGLNLFQLQSLCKHLADCLAISQPHVKSSLGASLVSSQTGNGSSTLQSTTTSQEKSESIQNVERSQEIVNQTATLPRI